MKTAQHTNPLHVLTVLRFRDFRVFWSGLLVQVTGQMMLLFTLGWLAFDLTGSPLSLGYVALFQAIPTIALTMLGGVAADRLDKRYVIIAVQLVALVVVGTLAFLTLAGLVELWHLMVAAFFIGATQSFENPSRMSLYPLLLPDRSQLTNAVTVFSAIWQVTSVVAPAIAGFVIAYAGAGQSFLISTMSFAILAIAVRLVRVSRMPRANAAGPLEDLIEGARYCWREKTVRILIGLSLFSGMFAFSYMMLLPIFARDILQVDARGLGVLASATGVGSIVGTFTTPLLAQRFHVGRLLTVQLLLACGILMAFAFSHSYVLSVALMPFLGFFAFSNVTLITIAIQMIVPDSLRGRVMGVQSLRWSMVPLGAAVLGVAANFVGAPLAVGGGAFMVFVVVALAGVLSPQLRELRSFGEESMVVAEAEAG